MHQSRRTMLHGLAALPASAFLARGAGSGLGNLVHDGAGLQRALSTAEPGAVIRLAPGDFADVAQFNVTVPGITLRAAWPMRSVIRAPMEVTGAGASIADLAFLGDGSDGFYLSAVAQCGSKLSISSPDVEVRGCDFGFFAGRAILVRPTGLRPYIHDCSFHDNRTGGDRNANEAIALGYDNPSSNTSMRARVVANRLWNLNVEGEAISVKTSDNTIQGNQLSSSKGGYTNRYGERNQFTGNVSTNARGFVIGDRDTRLVNNVINGSGAFRIMCGDATADVTRNGPHLQATNTYLQGNSGPLVIGASYATTPLPALNTNVVSHKGSIQLQKHSGTRLPS